MRNKFTRILLLAALVGGTCSLSAGASMKMASEAMEPVDPKKKKAGDECKASDECQKHHACTKEKDGDKSVCTAPPRPKLPPGVVT